jgi:hypothetical protein
MGIEHVPPNVLDKLKRCLALGTNKAAFENEAAIAMKIATKIMEDYGLSQAEVEMGNDGHVKPTSFSESYGYTCRDIWPWERTLGHVVDLLFPVKFFVQSGVGVVFVGATSDSSIAAAVYKILRSELLRISKNEMSPALRRSFLTGCTDILYKRAGEIWKAKQKEQETFNGSVDAGKALVVVKQNDLKTYLKQNYRFRNTRMRGSAHYHESYSRGAEAGQKVNLNFNKAIGG